MDYSKLKISPLSNRQTLAKARKFLIGMSLENVDIDLTGYIAGEIADIFDVSAQAMEIGLKS